MSRCCMLHSLFLAGVFATLLVGCSRDSDVRKVKYLESGQRYAEKGKYREAVIQFRNAIQVDPSYAAAHYQLAQIYLKLQQWVPAHQELDRTVELQSDDYSAHLDLANLLIAGHELEQAKTEVDLLLQKQANNPVVHIAAANLFAAQQDYASATLELKKAINLDPDRWDPYMRLGTLEMKMNEPGLAEVDLKRATQLNPKATAALLGLASYYQSQSRFAEAEQEIHAAIDANPNNPDPRADLVRLYMSEGKKTEAEQLARQVRHDFPGNPNGYRMLGDFYYAIGNVDGAFREYSALYREHPDDLQVKKNYIQLLILGNQLTEAAKLDNEILKASPKDVEGLVDRGQIELRNGNLKGSIDALQAALNSDSTSGIAYYHLGIALDRVGNVAQAEVAWQNAVRLHPDLSEAHLALARAALGRGDMPGLERSGDEIIRLLPASPEGYALRAFSYTQQGQFVRAQNDAARAISVAPKAPDGYLQMGNLSLARKLYADAEGFYVQALDRDPRSPEALGGLMKTYLIRNQKEKALAAAQAQIAKEPNSSVFYDLLGTAEFEYRKDSADLGAAESNLKKATELNKYNTDAWVKLGHVQAARGATEEAIATVQRALQDNLRANALHILAGQLFESKQDWERAQDCYRKALEIDSREPLASNNLAYVLTQTGGNLDLALSLAQTARRGMPDSFNAADTLGWVLYEKGAYRLAIDSFQEALRLAEKSKSPESPSVHLHLGMAYQKTGEVILARQHLERVLKLDPNYSSADDVKKLLAHLHS
jgi:tetratricopeptide (TPR) repeat protein